ncbi:MAG: hypothetical protein M1495_12980 [Bacteroidetes bacterium]|nr:hypothetical protein [Bacteroidota bacterium]
MKYEEKREKLVEMHESALRSLVIIPLLKSIGYSDVYEFHSSIEKGKDILFREVSKLGESFIHSVVVSTEDINGKVTDSKSASKILEQVEMVFNESFNDKYTGKKMSVDRCWVITSGTINAFAIESIAGKLEKYNLNRLVRFFDGDKLIELIDNYYPQFWQRKEEFYYYPKYEKINITTNKLDPPFDKDVDDLRETGNLKDAVYQIKKLVESLLTDVDYDIRDKFVEIIKSNNPWDIICLWDELKSDRMDINGDIYLSSGIRKIDQQLEYLEMDVKEYEERFNIPKNDDNK